MKEPLDGECHKAVAPQQGHLNRIKEEPDNVQEYEYFQPPKTQESDLKISTVFSVNTGHFAQKLTPSCQHSLLSSGPNTLLPSVPVMAVLDFCSGCKKMLYKGQTAYHKAGSTHLFCSTRCITEYSSPVCLPLPAKKTCLNCLKDILNPRDMITTRFKNSSGKDFCSQSCLSYYELKKKPVVTIHTNNMSPKCSMCQKNADNSVQIAPYAQGKPLRPSAEMIKTTTNSGRTEFFCSINCLTAYRIKTVISSGVQVACQSCKTSAIPQYHLTMSNGSVYSFCSSSCVVAFQNVVNKPQGTISSSVPLSQGQVILRPPTRSTLSTGGGNASAFPSAISGSIAAGLQPRAEQSQQVAVSQKVFKLQCQHCNHLFVRKPELLFYKGRMFLFCAKTCSYLYKKKNRIVAMCDYCKLQKIVKETVRFSGVDKPFCSEVCKSLSARDFGERWRKYCKMCSYCSQTSPNLVQNRVAGKLEEFCCEDCMSKYIALFNQMAKCDSCKRQGKLSESIKWQGNIKYFCNLLCIIEFCHQQITSDLSQNKVNISKAQTALMEPLSSRMNLMPVITNVVSLAKVTIAKSSGITNNVLKGTVTKETAKIITEKEITQTDARKLLSFQSSQPSRLLKNKAVLCKPITQTKAISCKPHIQHKECQTDLPLPNEKNDAELESPPAKKKRVDFSQTYDTEYLKVGFIICPGPKESSPRPQCIVCGEILSSEYIKPANLSHHLKAKHSELDNKPVDFFEQKSLEMECQNNSFKKCLLVEKPLMKASYLIALQIAASKKPFSITEELIRPYLVEMYSEIWGSSAGDKMKTIPLSNNTIEHRIEELSADVEDQLIQKVRDSEWFALQIDETSEISDIILLLCFIRFVDYDFNDIKEELLCCIEVPSQTTGFEVFELINKYIDSKSLNWKHCVGLSTDGAASMTGRYSGLRAKIQEVAMNTVAFTHCFIHREHLVAENLSSYLHEILLQSAHILGFIKTNAVNSRILTILCEEMRCDHVLLPLHAEVRCISRGRILTRLFELRHEIEMFLNQKHSALATYFHDEEWVAKLAYLSDIFSLINELNSSLQGTMTTLFTLYYKIDLFKQKLKLWLKRIQQNDYDMFPSFSEFSKSLDLNMRSITSIIFEHLEGLSQMFNDCYPPEDDLCSGNFWITNPFINHPSSNLTDFEEQQLAQLSSDVELKSVFKSIPITQFWIKAKTSYPELHEKAMKILLPFSTTYLCDATFSALTESKQRNLLVAGPALRLAVTSLIPRIEKLMKEKE